MDILLDVVILIGSPGSGKTTIGKKIAEQKGYKFVSTGDLWRECESNKGNDNYFGKQYEYISSVRHVNNRQFKKRLEDYIMNRLVTIFTEELSGAKGIVIDGFKNNDFTNFQAKIGKIDRVYELVVDPVTAKNRMIARKDNRDDDTTIDNIEKRLKIYNNVYIKEMHDELERLSIPLIKLDTLALSPEDIVKLFI